MNCQKIRKYLSPFIENELSQEKKALVENHLEKCPECADFLSYIKEAKNSLAEIPEVDVSSALLKRLYKIPKKKFKLSLDFLLKPALQPILAAAMIFMTLITLYSLNPEKDQINKYINQHIHMSYSKIERLYAKAGSLTNTLAGYKENILFSIKNTDFFWKKNNQP